MRTLYCAHATSIGGREGYAQTDDEQVIVSLAKPDGSKQGTNPEQLFACAYAACFASSVEAAAAEHNIEINNIKVKADVNLNEENDQYFLSTELNVLLPDIESPLAEKIVMRAHETCPYSKATQGNIILHLKVNDQRLT